MRFVRENITGTFLGGGWWGEPKRKKQTVICHDRWGRNTQHHKQVFNAGRKWTVSCLLWWHIWSQGRGWRRTVPARTQCRIPCCRTPRSRTGCASAQTLHIKGQSHFSWVSAQTLHRKGQSHFSCSVSAQTLHIKGQSHFFFLLGFQLQTMHIKGQSHFSRVSQLRLCT